MFFNQMFGQPGSTSPAALASPGMNPSSLAALMAMGGMGGGAPGAMGGPAMPQPPGASNNAPMGGSIPPVPGAQSNGLLQMLMGNPQLLKSLMGAFGAGAGGMPGGATGGSFYNGPGGFYQNTGGSPV